MTVLINSSTDWSLVAAILGLACYGLGAVATDASERFRQWLRPDPPKPRQYRVLVEDSDGWPLRSYQLPSKAVGRMMKDIERDKFD